MIQELFGVNNVGIIGGEGSKFSTPACGAIPDGSSSHSPSPSPSPSSSSAGIAATMVASEKLRCPRCDSSNTKFCYYNNYNLTQPRHFCKTCRRYWTKGGALRNVPIGGGCRKNRGTSITSAVGKSSSAGKSKTFSSDMGRSCLFSALEHTEPLSSNPILWASSENSNMLPILRANQNPNPNPNSSYLLTSVFGSAHLSSEPSISMNTQRSSLDHLVQLQMQSNYRNQQAQENQGIINSEIHNNGIHELYQRLRFSTSCHPDNAQVILGNVASGSSSTTSAVLGSAPVAIGELGFWNSNVSWHTDLPTTNGAYP